MDKGKGPMFPPFIAASGRSSPPAPAKSTTISATQHKTPIAISSESVANNNMVGASAAETSSGLVIAEGGINRKTPKLKSLVWDHFEKIKIAGVDKARCKYCGKVYAGDSNKNGTSTIKLHIPKYGKNPANKKDNKQSTLSFNSKEIKLTSSHLDEKFCRNALSKMLVIDELPMSHVNGQGFQEFVLAICPSFIFPSRHTCMRDIFSVYECEKERLHKYFRTNSPRVSLTTDTWTSNQQINYMCLTAHFIDDDWVLHKKIINFCPIVSHTGDSIGNL